MHGQATILAVDDCAENLHILSAALKAQYKIKVALNGKRALELALAAPQPDLILLDVMMPDMDGYEVCTALKRDPQTAAIPVLFLSSRDEEQDEAMGLSLGAIDYIVKPIRPSIVQARVRNHIELKRTRDMLERLTTQDHLTGISNRRRLDDYLGVEWSRAQREHQPISLIAIDIDHFKAVQRPLRPPGRGPMPQRGGPHPGGLRDAAFGPRRALRRRGVRLRAARHPERRRSHPGRADAPGCAGAHAGARTLGHAPPRHHQPGRGHRGAPVRRGAAGAGRPGRRRAL